MNISAISFGSLSGPAVEALNKGAADAGCLRSTGEGGISTHHLHGGDLIWQLGTAYFGAGEAAGQFDLGKVVAGVERHPVRAIEIKLSQGAKPGLGGVLPAVKVSDEIAAIRGVERSPPSTRPSPARACTTRWRSWAPASSAATGSTSGGRRCWPSAASRPSAATPTTVPRAWRRRTKWLVRGLDPTLKSVRAATYLRGLRAETAALAGAAGVDHPSLVPLDAFEVVVDRFTTRSAAEVLGYEPGWGLPPER